MRENRPILGAAAVFAGLFGLGAMLLATPSAAQNPVEALARAWAGSPHANAAAESFNHWAETGMVPVACATCHAGAGFRDFLGADGSAAGVIDAPAPNQSVIDCESCHNPAADALAAVTFPSGATIDGLDGSARCMVCHQGRASTASVDKATAELPADAVSADLAFINIHYRAAAASLMGTLAKGAYEYAGKTYAGRFVHPEAVDSCAECHDPHSTVVKVEQCGTCHQNQALTAIRTRPHDNDGDGDTTEGVAGEIATMQERLMQAIQTYAAEKAGTAIVYSADAHPYFFIDNNGDGRLEQREARPPNRYQSWTPRLLRAAYNYQFVEKDPGIYAHNPSYALQILYDSIADLGEATGADTAGLTRP